MAVIKQLDKIKSWLETEICPNFKFKQADNENLDVTYPYKLVNPNVFILYVPPAEIIGEANRVPSICIQFEEGNESIANLSGVLNLRLYFAVFNPGEHTKDDFTINTNGWRDVWNFVDYIMEKIRNTELIEDLRIIKENGIHYGPASDQGAIPDFYPYYYAWMTFSVEYGIPSSKAQIRNLL
jgi:hypothetical protein